MVADARSAVIAPSEALESKACSSLYVGIAYGVGFGVEKNMEESLSWISSSADQGSTTASLILQILKNPESRHKMIMRAFHDSVDGQANSSGQGNCGFVHQNAAALDLSSFSSTDGCNPLHYLSLFKKIAEPPSHSRNTGWDILKRTHFKSQRVLPEQHLQDTIKNLQGRPLQNDWNSVQRPDLNLQEQRLGEIVRYLGPEYVRAITTNVHYLHGHFPMTLSGTPLSFAITLNCREAIRALFYAIRTSDLLRESMIEHSGIRAAVSCHQSDTFSLIWSYCLATGRSNNLFHIFFRSKKGPHLISALAERSSLERTILHGTNRSSAQTDIINILIISLSALVTHRYCKQKNLQIAGNVAFAKLMSVGIEQILELGALDIAVEVRQTMSSRAVAPSLDKPYREGVLKAALHIACSGYFDCGRSKQYLAFSQDCRRDLNPEFQALKTMIEHKSESLFRSCVEDGMDVSGCDEDGQGLLHYMINTGFYQIVPISLLISRGADPNCASKEGQTPLVLAIDLGIPLVVQELLAEGAEPFGADPSGTPFLLHAVATQNYAVVARIFDAFEEKMEKYYNEYSLSQASQIKQHFLSYGADRVEDEMIDLDVTGEGSTALQIAAKNYDIEILRLLLSNGASLDVRDRGGNVALHYAVQGKPNNADGAIACCLLLLRGETRQLPKNKIGDTPLHLAAQRYEGESLRQLLDFFVRQHEFDIDVQNARGETILHQAAMQISVLSVATILEFGAAPNRKDAEERNAIQLFLQAAYSILGLSSVGDRRMRDMMDTLIDAGVDPLVQNSSQDSGGYAVMEHAGFDYNDLLFLSLYEIASQELRKSREPQTWHDWTSQEQDLLSAWSLFVAEEQWDTARKLCEYVASERYISDFYA